MKKKVVVILDVDTNEIGIHGLRYGINHAFHEEVVVDQVIETPFSAERTITPTDVALIGDMEFFVEDNNLTHLTNEQRCDMIQYVSEMESLTQCINDLFEDAAQELALEESE